MINDSQVRLNELEAAYANLQASHAKLMADYIALGGKPVTSHSKGSIDPYDDGVHIVIENPKFLTKEELSKDVHESLIEALKGLKLDDLNFNNESH